MGFFDPAVSQQEYDLGAFHIKIHCLRGDLRDIRAFDKLHRCLPGVIGGVPLDVPG